MSNYVTKQPIGTKAGLSADVQNLMPYLQNELAVIRKRDQQNIAATNAIKQAAMENPDDYRGTAFIANRDGTLGMNDPAMRLGEVKRDEDMSQQGINSETQQLDTETTQNLVNAQMDKLASDPGRMATVDEAKEIGSLDKSKMAIAAMNNQNAEGRNMLNNVPTPNLDVSLNQNQIVKPTNFVENNLPLESNQVESTQSIANRYGVPSTEKDIVPFDNKPTAKETPIDSAIRATKETGMAAKASEGSKNSNSQGQARAVSANWSYGSDISTGASELETKPVKVTNTTQMANIIDSDKSNLKQLRRASAIERAMNFQAGGTDTAPVMAEMKGRLMQREAFLNSISDKYGMKSTKQEVSGGEIKAKLGEAKASTNMRSGLDSSTSVNQSLSTANNVTGGTFDGGGGGGDNAPQGGTLTLGDYKLQGTDTGKQTPGGEALLKFNTPTDYTGGYGTSAMGRLIGSGKKGQNEFKNKVTKEWGGKYEYKKDGTWRIQNGNEWLELSPSGAISGEFSTNTANMFVGASNKAKLGANGQPIAGQTGYEKKNNGEVKANYNK
jgi:hypothetical protein